MSKRIPLSEPFFFGKEKDYVRDAIESTWISGSGKYLEKFESSIGEITDSPYVVACMNGTSALHLALTAAGVKSGDEVLAPTLTFISSINSILYSKASPVFFDSDEFFNIDQNKVINFLENNCEQKNGETFNKRTGKRVAAIIVVHVWGNACNFEKLIKICKERNILIIEDAAESLGTIYTSGDFKGKHTGTIGDFGCISFNGNKLDSGKYFLYTFPNEGTWDVVLNSEHGRFGFFNPNRDNDVLITSVPSYLIDDNLEQFTIDFQKKAETSDTLYLRLRWDNISVEIPIN